jgi:hypothetical protein
MQLAAMTPSAPGGIRRHFTVIDAAGMADIGWSIQALPEPGTVVMLVAGLLAASAGRHGRSACRHARG